MEDRPDKWQNDWIAENEDKEFERKIKAEFAEKMFRPPQGVEKFSSIGATLVVGAIILLIVAVIFRLVFEVIVGIF